MKAYLLPVALATSLGVNATLLSGGVQEVNAASFARSETVCVDVSPAQFGAMDTFIGNTLGLCDAAKEAFGIDACPAAAIRQRGVSIRWPGDGEENGAVCSHITQPGNWSPAE